MKDPSSEVKGMVEQDFKWFTEPITKIAEFLSDYQAKVFSNLTEALVQYQQKIAEEFSKIAQTFARTMAFLDSTKFKDFEYNWLIFLPIDGIVQLYKLHEAGKDEEVKELLVVWSKDRTYLDEFAQKMKNSNLFSPRIGLIQDAIDAHLTGKYSLSVPAFLAQIEGILWDYAEQEGIATGTIITKKDGTTREAHSAAPLVKDTGIQDSYSFFFV